MAISFNANDVSVTEEHGVQIVALAGGADDDLYLLVQHNDEISPQDRKLGMDTPYIELCNQRWSWYGHIDRFELHRDFIRIQMDRHAANEMKDDGKVEVRFAVTDERFSELQIALQRTFNGQVYFHENF
jgi:hypothetical protein